MTAAGECPPPKTPLVVELVPAGTSLADVKSPKSEALPCVANSIVWIILTAPGVLPPPAIALVNEELPAI